MLFPAWIYDPRHAKLFVLSLAVFVCLYRLLKKRRFAFEAPPLLLGILCAFALFLIPAIPLHNEMALLFFGIMFFIIIGASVFRFEDFRAAAVQKWTVLSALWISFIGIQNFYGITFFNIYVPSAFDRSSIIATVGNVNYVSNYLASILPITIAAYLTMEDGRWRFLAFIATVAAAVTVLWGQTRSVYLGLFVAFLVFFSLLGTSDRRHLITKRKLAGMVLGVVIILALYAFPPGVPENRRPLRLSVSRAQELQLPYDEATGSLYRRVFEWKTALEMFTHSPLYGWGWGSYILLSQDFQVKVTEKDPAYFGFYEKSAEAHSDFLQMLAETGIIGFGVWIALLLYIGILGVKRWLATKNLMILAALSGWLMILVHALTEFPLHMMPSAGIFAVFSGFLVSEGKRKTFPRAVGLAFLFLTLFFSFIALKTALADSFYAYGIYQREKAQNQYLKDMESVGRAIVLSSKGSEETPEWLEDAIRKEKAAATERLSSSYYSQYLFFTNALIADPGLSSATYEIATLIGKMEELVPRPPFLLFDFPPFRYTGVSALREAPTEYPELGRWVFKLKVQERERIEYLYRYFRGLCLSINSMIDPAVYLNIGRSANEMLVLYEEWDVEEPEERALWLTWMLYGYEKAFRLNGARQYTEDLELDHLDLEYLDAVIRHGVDVEERVTEVLGFRRRLAQHTLKKDWRFPKKWYNYFVEKMDDGYFAGRPTYRDRFIEVFEEYARRYREMEGYFREMDNALQSKETKISAADRYELYRDMKDIERFLEDFERRFSNGAAEG